MNLKGENKQMELLKKIKNKFNRCIFELSIECLGRSFIAASIMFLMQGSHSPNTLRLIFIVLLVWTVTPFQRLLDIIFYKKKLSDN